MSVFYHIRGTNGSGKSTLVREFLPPHRQDMLLNRYAAPTKGWPGREKQVPGYRVVRPNGGWYGVVGNYENACGGLDGLSSFAVQQSAIDHMLRRNPTFVLAEGVLSSTVFGSWATFDRRLQDDGHLMAWCYLQTPLEVCLARIKERQRFAGRVRDIKEDLVADKVRAVAATRTRAIEAGYRVYDLPYGGETVTLQDIIHGNKNGDRYRAS